MGECEASALGYHMSGTGKHSVMQIIAALYRQIGEILILCYLFLNLITIVICFYSNKFELMWIMHNYSIISLKIKYYDTRNRHPIDSSRDGP